MIIHKFGGSSLADALGFTRVAEIVGAAVGPIAVVVSAMGGVTDALAAAVGAAAGRNPSYRETLASLQTKH
nr:aspartate kinase [Pseudomonadota bacterium]